MSVPAQVALTSSEVGTKHVPVRALHSSTDLDAVDALMLRLAGTPAEDSLAGIVHDHLSAGGKRLRARLALDALEALGGRRASAVPWAAACELLHNATLVHDDLQDGDRTRRGQPAVWAVHGAAQAINTGDLMLMLPFLAIGEISTSDALRWRLCQVLAAHATATARGQARELELPRGGAVRWESYRAAVVGKTSALFQLPVEGSALLAGWSPSAARRLSEALQPLGVLFQLQDDVLDVYGDKGRGMPGSDLREGKISVLVVEHLARHPGDGEWLRDLLATPRDATPDREITRAIGRFRDGGALAASLARIRAEADAVRGAWVLSTTPALRVLVEELIEAVLAPIGHLQREALR